jgi:hypothetical protein
MKDRSSDANITCDKHFMRALVHLEILLNFVESTYDQKFDRIKIHCNEAKAIPFSHFEVN